MLMFLKHDHVFKNMSSFVNYVENRQQNLNNPRNAYFSCLNSVQKQKFHFNPDSPEILLDFNYEDPVTQATLKHFLEITKLTEEHKFKRDEIVDIKQKVKSALPIIYKYDSEISDVIPMLLGSFLFAKKNPVGAATNGDSLGATWLNPPANWQPLDYAECILHESVHQALFLDEMIHSHFTYSLSEMLKDDGLVTSAIRKTKRGYHLSFHSACVAVVLVDFYMLLSMPDKANRFLGPVLLTIRELELKKQKYLTAQGKNILDELEKDEFIQEYLTIS
jgi:hypothetical protein